MNDVKFPATWDGLESPSQRYELLLTLSDMQSACHGWDPDEASGFLLDDISAEDRPSGIVGGCLLDQTEERRFVAFLQAYKGARSVGRMTDELTMASADLLSQMRSAGVPVPSA